MSQEEWADWARSADIDISAFSIGPQPPAASQSPSHYATSSLETADEIEAAIAALLAPGPAMSSFDPLPSPANGTSQQVPNVAFPPSVGLSGSYRQVQGWMPFQPAHRPYEGTFDATYTVPDFWQPPPALRSSISTYPSASFPSIQQPPQPQPQLLSWPHPLQHSFRSTHAVPSLQPTQGSRVPGPSSRQNDRQAPYKKVPRPARPVHCKAAAQASGSASPSMGVTPSDTASSSSSARRQDTDLPGPTIWPKNRSCQCGYQFQYGLDDSPLESAYEHLDNAHHFVKPLSGRTVCGWPGCDKSYSTPRDFERHFKDEHLGVQYHCKNEDRCGHKPFGRPDKRGKHERRCQPDLAQASD
ncbi:hypothetical protein PQX77_016401 [Marasmius sp. AFHP31]|nr:hypothetical protein PQX77_016401 [Marasmius sp. AFHP31]